MIRSTKLLCFILISIFGCSTDTVNSGISVIQDTMGGMEEEPDQNPTTASYDYNLLFIGNSLTYINNLPDLVKTEAQKKGLALSFQMIAKPNYAIVDHWSDGNVQKEINTGNYDFVIIQQGPSSQADGYDMLVNDGKKYAEICKTNNTKLAYFMVWPAIYNYHTFDGVIQNYATGARANSAILCPVGRVWKNHFDRTGDFSYYGPDEFHPSLLGSQVAAEIIVQSLFR